MNRQISTEFFLGGVSLVLAVGLVNMADLLAFFDELAKNAAPSTMRIGALFLFLAAYVVFFLSSALSLVPVWRSVRDGTGSIPSDRGLRLLSVSLVSVMVAYSLLFWFAMDEALPKLSIP